MNSAEWELLYYQTPEGKIPFQVWLEALKNAETQHIVYERLARLRSGHFGKCAPVGNGVSELKINTGPGYRIYFGMAGQQIILLLLGGDKSTQDWDIQKAKMFWNDYKRRAS